MHEGAIAAALIQNILEVREKEKFSSVKTATVLIGRMHHVVPAVLQNHFRLLKKEYPPLAKRNWSSRSRRWPSPAAPAAK